MSDDDWTALDAQRVLALPLWRETSRRAFGWSDVSDLVYSNGTEAENGEAIADALLKLGPMLRRALETGVRALAEDGQFQSYILALYSGDRERIVELEAEATRAFAEADAAAPDLGS